MWIDSAEMLQYIGMHNVYDAEDDEKSLSTAHFLDRHFLQILGM